MSLDERDWKAMERMAQELGWGHAPHAEVAIVTGGRDYSLTGVDYGWLNQMWERYGFLLLLHGDCRGVDRDAAAWADRMGLCAAAVPADWAKHGRAAGPIRNGRMAKGCHRLPTVVLAFPGGRGTADMLKRARLYRLTVEESPSRKAQHDHHQTAPSRPQGRGRDHNAGRG